MTPVCCWRGCLACGVAPLVDLNAPADSPESANALLRTIVRLSVASASPFPKNQETKCRPLPADVLGAATLSLFRFDGTYDGAWQVAWHGCELFLGHGSRPGHECWGLLRFPHVGPAKKIYFAERALGRVRFPMSSWEEEIYTMVGGLAVFAVFCIAALLWLG
jgi:hypothetical protein